MQRLKGILKNQKTYIILLLIITSVFFYLRSVNRNLLGDEVTYCYIFEKDGAFNCDSDSRKINTFSDILESQKNHYIVVNGRSLIHTIEQYFSGIAVIDIYYVLNTVVFIFTIILFVKIMFNHMDRYKYWIFTIVIFLYLFPEQSNLWVSINFSLNYLWPLCVSLLFIYHWKKLRINVPLSSGCAMLLPLIGFITGWSHEAFVVPLATITVIYYCCNYKNFSYKDALLILPFWIGAALLVFAPGNFVRLQSNTNGEDVEILNNLLLNPFTLKLLPIFILLLFVTSYKRLINLKEFFKNNYVAVGLFIISLLFVLALRLVPGRTYIAVEFYSLILLVKLLKEINFRNKIFLQRIKPISIIITVLFIIHQCFVCEASICEKKLQDKFISQYKESVDGIAIYDYNNYGGIIDPYIRHFKLEIGSNPDCNYFKESLELYHTSKEKSLIPISSADYELISNYVEYVNDEETIMYSGPFYSINGCEYAWALADSVRKEDIFEFYFTPVSFFDEVPILMKFKRLISPSSYPNKDKVTEINEVTFSSNKFLAIKINEMRNVVDIKRVK